MWETMSCASKSMSCSSSEEDAELRRGPWTLEEDTLLIHYIARQGEGRWNLLAKRAGLKRTGKSCRLRWLNYLKPDVKRGNLSPEEQLLILDLHSKWGNRWSKIAQHLPGRTDNEIKNYWRTRVQKQARHLKVDANSAAFQDIIRCYWMPRLIQKIEGSSNSQCPMLSQNQMVCDQSFNYPFQYSTLPPPPPPPQQPQFPDQKPVDMRRYCLEQHHDQQNSDSEHGSGSCISSAESTNNISQISHHLPEYQTSPLPLGNSNSNSDYYMKNCYFVDSNCYDMEAISLAGVPGSGGFGNPERQVADCDWAGCDFSDSMWNMDELWQFRNLQEKEA